MRYEGNTSKDLVNRFMLTNQQQILRAQFGREKESTFQLLKAKFVCFLKKIPQCDY